MKKGLSWVLVIILTLLQTAMAVEITLPDATESIGDEAFMGDASITEVNMGDRIRTIGARAFRNCPGLEGIRIPNSVESIGADAFDPDTVLFCEQGSFAHQYALANNQPYSLGRYAILDVDMPDHSAIVTVDLDGPCVLKAELMDEEMVRTLCVETVELIGVERAVEHIVAFDSLPVTYFVLRVTLEDGDGNALCDPFIYTHRTQHYIEFIEYTPDQFPNDNVIQFENGGFGVFQDDVIFATGVRSGSNYIITSSSPLSVGSLIYLTDANDIVKAESVSLNGNGTYTVSRNEEASLLEFYKHLRYSSTFDLGQRATAPQTAVLQAGQPKILRSPVEYSEDLMRYTKTETDGPFTAEATIGAALVYTLNVSDMLQDGEYIECTASIRIDGSINYTFTASYEYNRSFSLLDLYFPTSVPGLYVDLDVTVPIKFKAEASLNLNTSFEATTGFRYNSDTGISKIQTGGFVPPHMTLEGELSGKAGIRIGLSMSAAKLLNIGIGAEIGASFTTKCTVIETLVEPEHHMCDLCFDVEVYKYINLDVSASYWTLLDHKKKLFSKTFPVYRDTIFDGYLSMINGKDSVHGGKVVMDKGVCPNYEYLIRLDTYDDTNSKINGLGIYVYRLEGSERVYENYGRSSLELYLKPGAYEAVADYNGTSVKRKFVVTDYAKTVRIVPETIPIDAAHFPDSEFRRYVKDFFDSNSDNKLTLIERMAVDTIYPVDEFADEPYCYNVSSVEGMEFFENLKVIALYPSDTGAIRYLNLEMFPLLEVLDCRGQQISSLDCSGNPNLRRLVLYDMPLKKLYISNCSELTNIDIRGTLLQALDLHGMTNLAELCCDDNKLTSLNLEGCFALTQLDCRNNLISELNLTGCVALEACYCMMNRLTTLDLSDSMTLRELICGQSTYDDDEITLQYHPEWAVRDTNQITTLNLSNHTELTDLVCGGMPLVSLNVSGCTDLMYLSCQTGSLSRLTVDVTDTFIATGFGQFYYTRGTVIIGLHESIA